MVKNQRIMVTKRTINGTSLPHTHVFQALGNAISPIHSSVRPAEQILKQCNLSKLMFHIWSTDLSPGQRHQIRKLSVCPLMWCSRMKKSEPIPCMVSMVKFPPRYCVYALHTGSPKPYLQKAQSNKVSSISNKIYTTSTFVNKKTNAHNNINK